MKSSEGQTWRDIRERRTKTSQPRTEKQRIMAVGGGPIVPSMSHAGSCKSAVVKSSVLMGLGWSAVIKLSHADTVVEVMRSEVAALQLIISLPAVCIHNSFLKLK